MTFTLNEEDILKKQIEIHKLEQHLQNLISTQPVLIPTKDVEITTLKHQIVDEEKHTTRIEYIKKVQPMKDSLKELIAQNEIMKSDNKDAIEIARINDELARQPIIDSINAAKNEMNILLDAM
jgi:Fe2+ transport system protein B